MSETIRKRMSVYCNGNFIDIIGGITCSILGDHPDSVKKEILAISNNNDIGNALTTCLNNSKELTYDEWNAIYGTNDQEFYDTMMEKSVAHDLSLIQKYGYKDKKALYKNMHSCSIFYYDDKLEIGPLKRGKRIDSYERFEGDGIEDIYIKTNTPPELLGAAVRYAFTRCKGKGLDVVTKALFPDGVPNSLEEYLESIDPDYKKWLVSA